jgi:uncharacterized damage-inducible protein DinB
MLKPAIPQLFQYHIRTRSGKGDTPLSESLRYPVGRFAAPAETGPAARQGWIAEIAALPAQLREAVGALDDAGLDTPYRPDGWSARQVVHHLADSHINSYVRFKLALTEDVPTIKPYDEAAWARLSDSRDTPVETSLALLEALHARWTALLRGMDDAAFKRAFRHPEHGREMTLAHNLALYAWHGRHHLGHIRSVAGVGAAHEAMPPAAT